jgi:hypothetical protein
MVTTCRDEEEDDEDDGCGHAAGQRHLLYPKLSDRHCKLDDVEDGLCGTNRRWVYKKC